MSEASDMSRMLFGAREFLDMLLDIVEIRMGRRDEALAALIEEIDGYRARRGWSADGFGGET